jgi:hypothetical protein
MPPVNLPRHCTRLYVDQHFLHPVVFRERNPVNCITISLELQEAPLPVWETSLAGIAGSESPLRSDFNQF